MADSPQKNLRLVYSGLFNLLKLIKQRSVENSDDIERIKTKLCILRDHSGETIIELLRDPIFKYSDCIINKDAKLLFTDLPDKIINDNVSGDEKKIANNILSGVRFLIENSSSEENEAVWKLLNSILENVAYYIRNSQ